MKRFIVSALLALALLALPFMAWAGAAKSDYNWQKSGHLMFYDGSTYETHFGTFPQSWAEDFLGRNATRTNSTSEVVAPFIGKIEAGGRLDYNATTSPGYVHLDANASASASDVAFYWGDNKNLFPDNKLVFETRVRLPGLTGMANASAWWGVGGDLANGATSSKFVGFYYNASSGLTVRAWNGTNQQNASATGVTLTAGSWNTYRVDLTDLTKVRYFVNGVEVYTAGLTFSTSGAVGNLQPFYYANRTNAASSAVLDVDYAKAFQNRE